MTVPHDGEPAFAGAGAAVAGSTPRALAIARELAARLGMRATTRRRRGPRRLPRRRVDRVELPRHAGGRGRAARRHRRRRPRAAGAARARLGRELGAARRRGRADGPDRARRRGHGRAPARRGPGARARPGRALRRDGGRDAGAGGSGAMKTLRTIAEVRAHVAGARRAGRSVGLVPTMGAFHAGHEALMRAARESCDEVIVSLFVNPAQFDEPGDLAAYPRTERADAGRAAELGVDALFAPSSRGDLPRRLRDDDPRRRARRTCWRAPSAARATSTASAPSSASCSTSSRPTSRSSARRTPSRSSWSAAWCATSTSPSRLHVVPTVREPDGLALSSRNARLDASERARAVALARGLEAVRDAVEAGERDPAAVEAAGRAAMAAEGVQPEYLAVVDPETPGGCARGRRAGTGGRCRPRRAGTADRQRPHRHRAGGDPARPSTAPPSWGAREAGANHAKEQRDVHPAPPRQPRRPVAPSRDPHQARRDARAGRADRDGDRLRPPERAGRRGGRRRHRPRRRQRRQQRARLQRHRAGHGRGDADARRGRAARPQHAAAGRRPAVRLLRGLRRAGDRDRAPLRQGGRLRRGQGRGLRRAGRARS